MSSTRRECATEQVVAGFALRFIPTARVGGSIDLGFASFELWFYGSALVTPRVGPCVALGF